MSDTELDPKIWDEADQLVVHWFSDMKKFHVIFYAGDRIIMSGVNNTHKTWESVTVALAKRGWALAKQDGPTRTFGKEVTK